MLVSMLLTDCVLSCIFSDKLDTCDLLFDQLVIFFFFFTIRIMVGSISPVKGKFNVKMLEFYQNCAIPNSAHSLTIYIEISLTKKVMLRSCQQLALLVSIT